MTNADSLASIWSWQPIAQSEVVPFVVELGGDGPVMVN